jgi:hypothetical protein
MPNRWRWWVFLGLAHALMLWGCATGPMMVDGVSMLMEDGSEAFEAEPDLDLLREALPAHMKLAEILQRNDPTHPGINLLLARLYGAYVLVVLEPRLAAMGRDPSSSTNLSMETAALRDRVDRCYRRGAVYAMAVLEGRHRGVGGRLTQIGTRDEALAALDVDDAPALFWYAFHLGGRVNLNRGNLRILAQGHLAEAAMRRVVALAPGFDHGAAHLFLMVYSAAQPTAMGRRSPEAEAHYQAVRALPDGACLAADVLYAREVLARESNRQAFDNQLDRVLAQGEGGARCLLDRLALEEAKRLREDPNPLSGEKGTS